MPEFVEVSIPVDPEAAASLNDERKRAAVGRIISRLIRPQPGEDPLLQAMQRLSRDALQKGLRPDALEAELAAHKAERNR